MTTFDKEQVLARYAELQAQRFAEFMQLPNFQRRLQRGDYDFVSSVDVEIEKLEQEATRNGFFIEANWDGDEKDASYILVEALPEVCAYFLGEELPTEPIDSLQ